MWLNLTSGSLHRLTTVAAVIAVAAAAAIINPSEATLNEKFLLRRQSGDSEQEGGATIASQGQQQPQQPARLYPDLPQQPNNGAVPFGGQYSPHQGPTPFLPFGPQMPADRIRNNPFRPPMPRQMTTSERLQSETFVNGLGRRLLSMVGIESNSSNETSPSAGGGDGSDLATGANRSAVEDAMKALRNSTVLDQLNKGVQSIYGGLSRMYNSTIQQQLAMLQERFQKETENSTNPWQQRMAQQVPQFFKSMATRVEEAQTNLNRILRQVSQANNGSFDPASSTRSSPWPFQGNNGDGMQNMNNFIGNIGRSFGQPSDPNDPQRSLGNRLMEFWHNQVQPQMGMLQGQITRVWRDLTASGALLPESMIRTRNGGANQLGSAARGGGGGGGQAENSSSDLVDNILKEVDINSADFALVDAKSGQEQAVPADGSSHNAQPPMRTQFGLQLSSNLMRMQRELNQLWAGLSGSLQGALANVRSSLKPRPQFGQIEPMASNVNSNKQEPDPAENEISGKIKDLSKLQRDADVVYDVVQQQQQQQQQQRPNFVDRFRGFFNNADGFGNMDRFSDRVGESVSRFGTVIGNFWNQIPERWDNFVQNNRRQQDPNLMMTTSARLTSPLSTTKKPDSSTPES